jgi:hypothetical protein
VASESELQPNSKIEESEEKKKSSVGSNCLEDGLDLALWQTNEMKIVAMIFLARWESVK